MRIYFLVVICFLFCGCVSQENISNDFTYNIKKSVVRVQSQKGNRFSMGTGVIVFYKGKLLLLTANHVVYDKSLVTLWTPERKEIKYKEDYIQRIEDADVFVMVLEKIDKQVIPAMISWEGSLGESVEALGFPNDGSLVRIKGVIKKCQVETSIPMDHGMSGGPLVSEGKVIGINSSIIIQEGKKGGGHIFLKDIIPFLRK